MFERFTLDTRAAVTLAQDEARELGCEIGAQHLLLGVLRAAGQELSAVLDCSLATAKRRVADAAQRVHHLAASDPVLAPYLEGRR